VSDPMDHPDAETIALLAEGKIDPSAEEALHAHLAVCPECRGAFADAVRFRAHWLNGKTPADGSPDLAAEARSIPVRPRGASAGAVRRRSPRLAVLLPVVAAIGLGLAAVVLLRMAGNRSSAGSEDETYASLVPLLGEASRTGLILPGAAGYTPREGIPRGGEANENPAVWESIRSLTNRVDHGEGGEGARKWLIATLLASGRLETARARLDDARRSAPDDPGLQALEGVLAYRESRLADAETWFRKALAGDPGDSVIAFDLAAVLAESGKTGEANRILETLHASDGTLLARRLAEARVAR
jgi:tetratricopeptide (TPR) repeat protein